MSLFKSLISKIRGTYSNILGWYNQRLSAIKLARVRRNLVKRPYTFIDLLIFYNRRKREIRKLKNYLKDVISKFFKN